MNVLNKNMESHFVKLYKIYTINVDIFFIHTFS